MKKKPFSFKVLSPYLKKKQMQSHKRKTPEQILAERGMTLEQVQRGVTKLKLASERVIVAVTGKTKEV